MSDCEHGGYSHKKGRVYCRTFSYAEARERHAAGESYGSIARDLGVNVDSVRRAVDPVFRAKFDAKASAWMKGGICPDCGKEGTTRHRLGADLRCADCALKRSRTTVVFAGDGSVAALCCVICHEWKPRDKFPAGARKADGTRGNQTCSECGTKARNAYRQRNKVPCETCGAPCLPPKEKGPNAAPVARCRACFYESRRKAAA